MKRATHLLALLAIALSSLAAYAGEATESAVHWTDASWDEVLATAKKENKHVFIDFYATWCGPCKRMDKTTFMDPKVGEFLNANIPVSYDAEKGVGEELAGKYRVSSYPTFLLIGPDGNEVDRHIGYLESDEFLEMMVGYTRGIGTLGWYEAQVQARPDDLELRRTLGVKYADAVIPDQAELHLGKVLEMDPNDEHGWRAEALFALGDANRRVKRSDKARLYFEKLIADSPDSDYTEQALTLLARVEYDAGNTEAAVAAQRKYLEGDPGNPSRMNAFAWFCSQRAIGLDEALPVALKAVELSNRDPGILDTLAEVYFAMGDYDNALKIGQEALATDPEDTYFNDQVKKYKKAKADAEPQAAR